MVQLEMQHFAFRKCLLIANLADNYALIFVFLPWMLCGSCKAVRNRQIFPSSCFSAADNQHFILLVELINQLMQKGGAVLIRVWLYIPEVILLAPVFLILSVGFECAFADCICNHRHTGMKCQLTNTVFLQRLL